jgi:hypothetical protein
MTKRLSSRLVGFRPEEARCSRAIVALLSLLLAASGGWGLTHECKAAAPEIAPTAQAVPAGTPGNTLWLGLKSHGVPIDPVAAGLNYAELTSHDLDFTFHPAIGPHDPFIDFTRTLHTKVVSHMPIIIPSTAIDPKMLLQISGPSGDEKMIVPAPTLEPENLPNAGGHAK